MSLLQKLAAAALAVLLVLTGWGWWETRQLQTPVRALTTTSAVAGLEVTVNSAGMPVVDEGTYLTATRLARRATTPEEQAIAQEAVQAADHELDLAFAVALQHLEAYPPPLSPEATRIQQRLLAAQQALVADGDELKRLQVSLAQAADADKPAIQDHIDLVQSQVELEQDVVKEADADLLAAGGNLHQRIRIMQQEHESAHRIASATAPAQPQGALATLHGVVGRVREWLLLREKRHWLGEALQEARTSAETLKAERGQIATALADSKARLADARATGVAPAAAQAPARGAPQAAAAAAPPTLLELTRQVAAEQHRLTLRDERIAARERLARIYGRWEKVVETQAHIALHACLAGFAVVLAALLLLLFADRWLLRLLARARVDRRQLATLRSVIGVALQLVAAIVILLALIGMPGQLGTMLGIVGAGLTVALKDFIVAFIGWFVLMGRNGMRLGDWVEINGVSGEVVELNMFHTVLLETGNWTDPGQPTGRRVTFTNSFAISGHYFNFSTSGQWLWDELTLIVPSGRDPQAIAEAILREVTTATAQDTAQAEEEWRRAARGERVADFTAQPGIALRPTTGGTQVTVRYVTRAGTRLALRSRLYQSAVRLLAEHG